MYVDLHGHSKKHNVFIYGCENRFDPLKRFRERVFPVMMSKNAPAKACNLLLKRICVALGPAVQLPISANPGLTL